MVTNPQQSANLSPLKLSGLKIACNALNSQVPARAGSGSFRLRSAFTLLELLVAMTVTLIMMSAIVTIFSLISSTVTSSRAETEMTDRVRSAAMRIQEDLDNVTATMMPPLRPEAGLGYFEYIEGRANRGSPVLNKNVEISLAGDLNDILMFTVHSPNSMFVGRIETKNGPVIVESDTAEIVYFTDVDPLRKAQTQNKPQDKFNIPLNTLYRQVRLVLPSSETNLLSSASGAVSISPDISVRIEAGRIVPNSLADLTKRENRHAHNPKGYPFQLLIGGALGVQPFAGSRVGQDVVLTNVLAFDVKAWDPEAEVQLLQTKSDSFLSSGQHLQPFLSPANNANPVNKSSLVSKGAFVDLNYANGLGSHFSGPASDADPRRVLRGIEFNTYDTYSFHYEHDGINQGGPLPIADEGVNGIDDNPGLANGTDDRSERETLPPYSHPLRGIEVTIRVLEPDSRKVRQVRVVGQFLPQ